MTRDARSTARGARERAGWPALDWDRLEALFEAACALPAEERPAFLDRECSDPHARSELEALLSRAAPGARLFDALADSLERWPSRLVPAADPLLGSRVGHYRIEGRLGTGGMGIVYRARDTRLERKVALKFLPPHLGLDPEAKERFLVEARAAAALDHSSICTVHEVGETQDGRPFLAMALYEGETLKERIARGPLSVEEAVGIAARIARGLAAAHARGIVHRDVKPGNVMLTADGEVTLLDFGLAKMSGATMTRPGTTPGTVAYMSPEQVRGEGVDRRSDLWSLGVVLYEMLAGERPFRGDNYAAVLQAVLHREPESLRGRRPEVPAGIAEAVGRLLAKHPHERLPSADRLLTDLESPPPEAEPGSDSPFIAVLPFDNLSPDPEHKYFSEGMSQDILLHLARLDELRVVGPISAARVRGGDWSVQQIAGELGVDAVLMGSVRTDGDRVRIWAQLLDARTGEPRWADAYDRDLAEIFEVQTEVARSVAISLLATLSPTGRTRLEATPTEDLDAYNLYLMGRHLADRRDVGSLETALGYFRRATELDPGNARAHVGIADVYTHLVTWGALPTDAGFSASRDAVTRALELDPSLADAWVNLGYLYFWYEWEWGEAERAFRRAIELNPGYSTGHHWYSLLLVTLGRFEEAEEAIGRAARLDPLSRIIRTIQGRLYWLSGRTDRALEEHRTALELDPAYSVGHMWLALTLLSRDEIDEAVRHLRRGWELSPDGPVLQAGLALSHAARDEEEQALEILQDLRSAGEGRTPVPFWDAVVHAQLGRTEPAFESLEEAVRHRDGWLTQLRVNPLLDPLRDDPRYEDLLRRMVLD